MASNLGKVSRYCAPLQKVERTHRPRHDERLKNGPPAVPEIGESNSRARVVELYAQLRRAPSGSEDFELLMAEFNRACAADPQGVLRALQTEAFRA